MATKPLPKPKAATAAKSHLRAICQLWVDPRNGNISHSKFWNNIACGVATVIVIRMGTDITLEFFQWYLGIVGFQALASKFLALRLGGSAGLDTPKPTDKE
jgi:hypothetical protein